MKNDVLQVVGDAVDQTIDISGEDLRKLAERLAVWSVRHTTNDLYRLRERGLSLAGAIMDWAEELYPPTD